jgi:TPP-dependent indolepyruvate ferredoxin oxidoreductase alpha subunit
MNKYYFSLPALPLLYFIFSGLFGSFEGTGTYPNDAYIEIIKKAQSEITPEAEKAARLLVIASNKFYKEKQRLPQNIREIDKFIKDNKLKEVDFKQFSSVKYKKSYSGTKEIVLGLKCLSNFDVSLKLE